MADKASILLVFRQEHLSLLNSDGPIPKVKDPSIWDAGDLHSNATVRRSNREIRSVVAITDDFDGYIRILSIRTSSGPSLLNRHETLPREPILSAG